jgi:hypothetical protein
MNKFLDPRVMQSNWGILLRPHHEDLTNALVDRRVNVSREGDDTAPIRQNTM